MIKLAAITAALIALWPLDCFAQITGCPSTPLDPNVEEMVPLTEDAVKLADFYERISENPSAEARQRAATSRHHNHWPRTKTRTSAVKIGNYWKIEIIALAATQPEIWTNYIDMRICSVDGRVDYIKFHG